MIPPKRRTDLYLFNWTIVLIAIISFNSCKDHKTISFNQDYSIDTIKVSIGDSCLQTYTTLRNRVYGNNFYCFNKLQHCIDIFDLSAKQLINQLKIDREGANGITNIEAFCVCGDSIFIQNETNYILLNHRGEIIRKISKDKLNNLIDQNIYSFFPTSITLSNFENLIFDKKYNELIIPINITDPLALKDKSCIATIDIEKETVNLLPVYFPSTVTNKYYGKLATAQILSKGDSIIYNFANSSYVYIYDRTNKQTYEYNIKSDYTPNLSESLDKNANMERVFDHYLHSLFFHNMQYDEYRNLYYRIHTDKSNDKSAFNNKETFLTIINSQFEKINEIKLPSNTYPVYNIASNGLIFVFMKGLDEDYFSYAELTNSNIYKVSSPSQLNILPQETAVKNKNSQNKKNVSTKPGKAPVMTSEKIGNFIKENMIYPEYELENKIEGYVYVVLESDSTGNVISYNISEIATTTDNENFRKEALRIGHLIKQIYPNITFAFYVPFLIDNYLENHKNKVNSCENNE